MRVISQGPQLGTTVLLILNSQSYSLIRSQGVAQAGRLCFSGILPDEIGLKKENGRKKAGKEGRKVEISQRSIP